MLYTIFWNQLSLRNATRQATESRIFFPIRRRIHPVVLGTCFLTMIHSKCQNASRIVTTVYWLVPTKAISWIHYGDVIMGAIASQITNLTIAYSTVYSDADQTKHQSSASLAFVRGIHRGPVNFPHKWPVTRKMFPFDDVIMLTATCAVTGQHPALAARWLHYIH